MWRYGAQKVIGGHVNIRFVGVHRHPDRGEVSENLVGR